MKILLDECIDHRFRFEFADHDVRSVSFMEWNALQNGVLLEQAEQEFDVFVTVDANIRFQQNLEKVNLAIIILRPLRNKLSFLNELMPQIEAALRTIQTGDIITISPKE